MEGEKASFLSKSVMKLFTTQSVKKPREMFEITSDNGYVLCDKYFIPEEILAQILGHVPPKELVFSCRRVCKWWCNIIDFLVWRIKLQRIGLPASKIIELPWFACYRVDVMQPFNRNLIKNNCGQDGLKHWKILSSGGDGWKIEKPPLGCEDFPLDDASLMQQKELSCQNYCFATSYISCTKAQLIDLKSEGLCPELMDILQPPIFVCDWCSGRFDCESIYEMEVKLLDKDKKIITFFASRLNDLGAHHGNQWQKISHVFKNYGPGIRYIEFYHGGMDERFWKGHYGSKMTGATVIFPLEKSNEWLND